MERPLAGYIIAHIVGTFGTTFIHKSFKFSFFPISLGLPEESIADFFHALRTVAASYSLRHLPP